MSLWASLLRPFLFMQPLLMCKWSVVYGGLAVGMSRMGRRLLPTALPFFILGRTESTCR